MRVTVIGDRTQEFQGARYYLCGAYFQRRGQRLHRIVWEAHNGPIAKGMHVHHRDHDRANNQPENLELLPAATHLSQHARTEENRAAKREHMVKTMVPKAAAWHSSPEGRAWHSQQGKANKARARRVEVACQWCGMAFLTPRPKLAKFCHLNCKMAALRARRKAESGSGT